MLRLVSSLLALPLLALVPTACSEDSGSGSSGGGAGGEASDGTAGGSGSSSPCGERPDYVPESGVCLEVVTGTVVDERDELVADLDVTVCGPSCSPGRTAEDGSFTVEVNSWVLIDEYSVQPHGTPTASTFYYRFPEGFGGGDHDSGVLKVLDLPADGDQMVVKLDKEGAPAQTVTSGEISLEIEEGTQVVLGITEALLGDPGRTFRARRLSDDEAVGFEPELAGATVYALGPFEAQLQLEGTRDPGRATLHFENTEDLAPGASVVVEALGTYLGPNWVSPNEFAEIGVATVSADGTTIDLPASAAGAGFTWFTWLALRAQ